MLKIIKDSTLVPTPIVDLKLDSEPRLGSTDPVTSEGVKNAIDGAVGDASEALQEQIDEIAEKAGSGYTPKGEADVATLNGLSGQENGWLYTMTDSGTLTLGTLAVVAGDTVAWDEANSVWYKAMDYAPRQYGTNEVHKLATTITAFRTGDVIPVDGPSGTAKMPKDDLLKETAENALSSICEKYDQTKQYEAGEIFYIANTVYQAKRNTDNALPQYITEYADPVPLDEIVDSVFNPSKNVITFFANLGIFIISDGRERAHSECAITDYISVEGMSSLFVRTHFGNAYGGGVACYDGDKNFISEIHDDGQGGYSGAGEIMDRSFSLSDLPVNTQYIRVSRFIEQDNASYVIVNGVAGGEVAKKIDSDKVADEFSNKRNYVPGNIISDNGDVAVCKSHLFGGDIDWAKFDKTSIGSLVEKIFADGYKYVDSFEYRDIFINTYGNDSSSSGFESTQFVSLVGVEGIVALGNFGNPHGGGLSFYDSYFNFISQIHDDGSGAYPSTSNQVTRAFTSSDFPANAVYVRLTNRYGLSYKSGYMCLFGSAMRGGEVSKKETNNTDRCCEWLENHTASISTDGTLIIPKSPNTKNNYTISASAEFSTFGRISLYRGTGTKPRGHVEVDGTNVYEYDGISGDLLSTTPHGITMAEFINVSLSVGQKYGRKAHLVVLSGAGRYEADIDWAGCTSNITLKSISGAYTNCNVKLSGVGYRMDTWVFGDSYCDHWPDYLLELKPDVKFFIDSFSGRTSLEAYSSLLSDLRFGFKPKRIVWAMGMNDTDNGAVNSNWKNVFDLVKSLCEKMGIDFIPCTIPCTPTNDNSYKNAYIVANCTEYVDVARCVGATEQGSSWFAGLLAGDNKHASTAGRYVIANEMLGYLGV